MNSYKTKDFEKILRTKGYRFKRQNGGSHRIYTNGKQTISVPMNKEVNGCLAQRLIKEM